MTPQTEARLRAVFEQHVPFNRLIGLQIASTDPAKPQLRFDMKPELIGNPAREILHGGVISAALDVTAGYAIFLALLGQNPALEEESFPNMGTIDLRVDYLRPGRGKYFVASGRVLRLG